MKRKFNFKVNQGHNFVDYLWNWPIFNPNINLVNINVYIKLDQNPFISSEDIEW